MKARYRLKYRLFRPALIVLQIAEQKSSTSGHPPHDTHRFEKWRDARPDDFVSEFEL